MTTILSRDMERSSIPMETYTWGSSFMAPCRGTVYTDGQAVQCILDNGNKMKGMALDCIDLHQRINTMESSKIASFVGVEFWKLHLLVH